MSAYAVTDRLVEAIHRSRHDVIICNYANADMVGHTGNFEAAVKAVEVVDRCLGRVVAAAQSVGGEVLITSDHGNAEKMREVSTKTHRGQPHTAHTSNRVPFLYVGRPAEIGRSRDPRGRGAHDAVSARTVAAVRDERQPAGALGGAGHGTSTAAAAAPGTAVAVSGRCPSGLALPPCRAPARAACHAPVCACILPCRSGDPFPAFL